MDDMFFFWLCGAALTIGAAVYLYSNRKKKGVSTTEDSKDDEIG